MDDLSRKPMINCFTTALCARMRRGKARLDGNGGRLSLEPQRRLAQLVLATGLVVFGTVESSLADDELMQEMQRCVAIAAAMERLACFDNAVDHPGRVTAKSTMPESMAEKMHDAAPAPGPEPTAEPVREKTLDDLGAKPLLSGDAEKDELTIRTRVTRCEKDARKKYYFVFENGQVWKQVSDRRLTYKHCDFEVTITKDFFGYKMQPDGEKRRVSIARVN